MYETRIDDEFEYTGFGFPVRLLNVPMIKIRDFWTPNINYNELEKKVFLILTDADFQLTGSQIRFINQYKDME